MDNDAIICEICGEEFKKNINLTYHLKNKHDTTVLDYIVKYYYNDEHPKCKCGCGEKTTFIQKRRLFRTYYKNHSDKDKELLDKRVQTFHNNFKSKTYDGQRFMKKHNLTRDDFVKLWDKYQLPKNTADIVSKSIGIDFRTIKKFWGLLDIADKMLGVENDEMRKIGSNPSGSTS